MSVTPPHPSPPTASARASGLFDVDGPHPHPDESLVDRIKWTTLARVGLLTLVLAFGVAMDLGMGPQPASQVPETTLYSLTTAFYLASFFGLLATHLLRHSPLVARVAWLSVGLDAALALGLVTVTDGLDSLFLFSLPLAVLNSAILLHRAGGMAAATLTTAGLALLGMHELAWLDFDLTPWRVAYLRGLTPRPPMPGFEVAVELAVQAAAAYATALLSAHLVQELDKARQRAVAQRRELAQLRVRHEDVVSSLPDGLLTVTRGVVTSVNPAGLEILGLLPGQVQGLPIAQVLPELADHDLCATGELEIARSPTGHTRELQRRRDGSEQILACRVAPLRDPSGQPGQVVVLRDMTQARARDEQHRQRERLAAIGAMAAAVAHEIRNPLASISGSVQMLNSSDGLSETDRALMRIVLRETDQLSQWIGEFLDFAKPRPVQLGTCDLRAIALETLQACGNDPRVQAAAIELRAGAGLQGGQAHASSRWHLQADPIRLRQAVWNLLINATQAVLEVERRVVELSLGEEGDQVTLTVDDSGPGVASEDVAHIFEPFYTKKGEGTGLGLATVRRHVTAHRGTVRIERSPLGGARFVIAVPRRPSIEGFLPGSSPSRVELPAARVRGD